MAKPMILIGIGTSGMRVLEYVQSFYYENTGKNKPPHVEYIYLETDENAHPGVTALPNEIRRVQISLKEKATMINDLKDRRNLDADWLPPASHILDTGHGAGGLPAFGRLALWGHNNFETVETALKAAHRAVSGHDTENSNNAKPAVFITGSITGGTGTGILVDMAYLVRNLITDITEVYGLYLIPPKGSYNGKEVLYCNTYAGLRSLAYYNDRDRPYTLRWPNGSQVNFEMPPYELVQVISQDYNDGAYPPIASLTGLYKMAGMYLFLNIFGLYTKRMKRLVDAWGSQHLGKHGTFGLSAIQYPKSQLEEYLAVQKSTELLRRWVDPETFMQNGSPKKLAAVRSQMVRAMELRFEEILREAFDNLDAIMVGNVRIVNDIERQAHKINRKQFQEEEAYDAIYKLYNPSQAGYYYQTIKGNLQDAVDLVIERIHELVVSAADQFENLNIVGMQLNAIKRAIDQTIDFWKASGVMAQAENWANQLNGEVKGMLRNRYGALGERDRVLTDRMRTTLDLMKMHLFALPLKEINEHIQSSDQPLTSMNGTELPSLNRIRQIIQRIDFTLGKDDTDGKVVEFKTLAARKADLEADVADDTIPILKVFPAGTFEREVDRADDNYVRKSGIKVPSKTVVMEGKSLWKYLAQGGDRLPVTLYRDCISSFIRSIRTSEAVPDLELASFVNKKPSDAARIAERATAPFVLINSDQATRFDKSSYIPKLVVGQDPHMVKQIVDTLKDQNFHEFQHDEDGVWINEDLKNLVVFYQEHGMMNGKRTFDPLRDLRYMPDVVDLYQEYASHYASSPEEWHRLRIPYFPYEADPALPTNPPADNLPD